METVLELLSKVAPLVSGSQTNRQASKQACFCETSKLLRLEKGSDEQVAAFASALQHICILASQGGLGHATTALGQTIRVSNRKAA
jgi:hypothetical protein